MFGALVFVVIVAVPIFVKTIPAQNLASTKPKNVVPSCNAAFLVSSVLELRT